jgi:hypothetical protein
MKYVISIATLNSNTLENWVMLTLFSNPRNKVHHILGSGQWSAILPDAMLSTK